MGELRPHDRPASRIGDPLLTRLVEALFQRAAARARQFPGSGDALDDGGPDADDAWLLWHLGAEAPARVALERAAARGDAAAALALCLSQDSETLVRHGLDLLARFDQGETRGELARMLWLELWLHRDAPEQASALARASGRLGSPLDIWPLPRRDTGRTEEPGPFDRWLSGAWREALDRRDWRRVMRLMITGTLAGVRRLPEPVTAIDTLPQVLAPWFIDHSLESLTPGALSNLANAVDDAAEATALRVLACVLLERHDPLLAAFDELGLAESGADHLPALLRARAQRALVQAGQYAEAADVAASRTGYCQDDMLIVGLLLCSVLHGLLADELPDNLADQARQLHETCHRLGDASDPARAPILAELCMLTMSMCEVSAYALGGRRGLASLYDQLEIGNDTRVQRHIEALLLEGDDPLPMAVLDALHATAAHRPLALPLLMLRHDPHRVPDAELGRALGVLTTRHPEMARGLASLQLWLEPDAAIDPRARAGVDASSGLRRQVLAVLGVGQHDEVERIEVVDRLCEAHEADVAVAARLMRARRFLDEGSPQAAFADLTWVSALLEGRPDPMMTRLVERVQTHLDEPELATRVHEMGTRRRLERRLEAEPEVERGWQQAVELGRDGQWADGGERLLEAGSAARDPWLASRLLQLAVRWLDEHARQPQRALEAARQAATVRPADADLCRVHARLLARQGELAELDALMSALPSSASNGRRPPRPIDLVDRELVDTLGWIVTRTTRRAVPDADEDDHSALVSVLDRCLRLDELSGALRLDLLRAWATLRTWQGATAEVHARLSLALEAAEQPDERAALALLLARHEPRTEHAVECLLTALSQPDTRRAALRHLTELHARSSENQRFVDRLLVAADGLPADAALQVRLHAARLLVEHLGRGEEAATLLVDLVPADIDSDADLSLLESLLDRIGQHDALMRVLEQRIIRETTPALRSALRLRMADLIGTAMPEQARALRVAALRDAPTDRALFESLAEQLRADGATRLLHEVLDIAIDAGRRQSGGALVLADLLVERGQLDLEVFDDADAAARSFMDALRLDPRNDLIVARIDLLAGMLGEPYLVGLAREIRLAGTPVGDPDRARALVAAARSHIGVGALGRAIPQLEEAFELEPAAADVAMLLVDQLGRAGHPGRQAVVCMAHALALAETGQFGALLELARFQDEQLGLAHDAVASLEAVLDREPGHAGAHDVLVEIYATHEDWEGVLEVTEHALEHVELDDRARADLLLRVAALYVEKLGNTRRAVMALREARDLAPDHVDVLGMLRALLAQRGEWDEALEVVEQLVSLLDDEASRVQLLVEGARIALDHLARPQTAHRLVDEALAVRLRDPAALDVLLDLRIEAADWTGARELLARLEEAPGIEPASIALREGIVARGEARIADAAHALLRVLDQAPSPAFVERALTVLLELVEAPEAACDDALLEHLEQRLAAHHAHAPDTADTSALRDALVAVLSARAWRLREHIVVDESARVRALGWLERATVLAPRDPSVQELHSELLLHAGQPAQALQRTLDLVGHLERGTRAWRRAMLQAGELALEAVGDPERAIDLLTELRRRAPGELDASYQLARAWLVLGDAQAARRHVERAVAAWEGADPLAMPERQRQAAADHHTLLAEIVEQLGDAETARRHLARAGQFLRPAAS